MNQLCKVCGEPAAGFHFGAFTCEGCKSFFGRTYNNISSISECKNNGECVINKKNRTACKACRLRKCLLVGMSKSGSRYGRRSNWFKIHCLLQEQQQQAQQHVQQHAHAHAAGAAAAANMAAAAAAAANLLRPHPYLSPLFRSSPLTSSTTMGSTRETRSSESDSGASSADPDDDARSSSALGYPLKPTGSPISDRDYFSGASLKKLPSPASDSECFDRRKFISALVNAPSVSPASLPSISPSGLTPSRWMMPSLQGMAADTALWRDLWSKSILPPCSTANNVVNNSQVDHQQLEPIDLSVKSQLVTGVPPPHPSSDSDSSCNSDPELCIDVGIDEPVKSVPLDLTLDRPATDVVSN